MRSMYQNDQDLMKKYPESNSEILRPHSTYSSHGDWFSLDGKSDKITKFKTRSKKH